MARFDEAGVTVRITILRLRDDDQAATVVADVSSRTAEGVTVRTESFDITGRLTNAQRNGATALLDAAATKVREVWGIPEPEG